MIRIYLVLLFIFLAFMLLRWFLKTPPPVLGRYARILFMVFIGTILLLLVATGRMNWLFALFGIALAFVGRFLPVLLRYAPQLQRLWFMYKVNKQESAGRQGKATNKGKMGIDEAYEILGLKPGASQREIIDAHRRLMQRNHPDRGGTDYLAARINLAKETLLKH